LRKLHASPPVESSLILAPAMRGLSSGRG